MLNRQTYISDHQSVYVEFEPTINSLFIKLTANPCIHPRPLLWECVSPFLAMAMQWAWEYGRGSAFDWKALTQPLCVRFQGR